MIDARELRIGNSFYPVDRKEGVDIPQEILFVVAEIFPFAVRAYQFGKQLAQVQNHELISFPTHKVSPIPLTEEWLLKFGFSSTFSSDPQNFPSSKLFQLNGFKIHQPIEGVDQFIFEPIIEDYIEFKSVHQLQNIFHALTGSELECN